MLFFIQRTAGRLSPKGLSLPAALRIKFKIACAIEEEQVYIPKGQVAYSINESRLCALVFWGLIISHRSCPYGRC